MATLLLIVRWVVALLLLLFVVMLPSVWMDRRSLDSSRSTAPILILMAGAFGSAAYSLITASWTPLLVTLQMGFGLGMILLGLVVSFIFYRDKRRDAITHHPELLAALYRDLVDSCVAQLALATDVIDWSAFGRCFRLRFQSVELSEGT